MKTTIKAIIVLILLVTITLSCGEGNKEEAIGESVVQQPINPNGDSELALLMRAMFDEAQAIKTQIDNGEPVTIELEHEKILTADATEPDKAASPEYKAFAGSYLQSIQELQAADSNELLGAYNTMVVNCMTCHKSLCPGPMVKIKKLQ